MADHEHFVQFYDSDEYMVHAVGGFIGSSLSRGDAGIVVVTKPRRDAIEDALAGLGFDVVALAEEGRYVAWDADETLERICAGGFPDEQRFDEAVRAAFAPFEASGLKIRAFGEMVARLVERGSQKAAIRLEELWSRFAQSHRATLFCAYPLTADLDPASLSAVCKQHSGIIPAESYSALDGAGDRMQAVVTLQQRVRALEAEIAKRKEVERAFLRRLRATRA